jgi:hypothetical protein
VPDVTYVVGVGMVPFATQGQTIYVGPNHVMKELIDQSL